MKKLIKYLLIVFVCIVGFNVNAETYNVKDLIPVDTSATVDTELFTYDGFSYNSTLDAKGYAHLTFSGITSKATSKVPISINVLLYDENQINVGFLTYCTDQDYSTDNNRRKISPGERISFDIPVTKRYFPTNLDEENGPSKVKYISVLDDNEYCNVGGYDKYIGLSHDDVVKGITTKDVDGENLISQFTIFILQDGVKTIALITLFTLIFLFIQGIILNMLHSKMFIDSTLLAYVPIGCNYVAVKCAFGPKIAKIYIILLLLSIPLSLVVVGIFISAICGLVSGIAFLLVLIKLITKKYDLCYYDPEVRNVNNNVKVELSKPQVENSVNTKKEETLDNDDEINNNDAANQVVDLNFGDSGFSYNDSTPDPSVLSDNDSFEPPVSGGANTNPEVNNDNNNNQDGGSDLTKFFS